MLLLLYSYLWYRVEFYTHIRLGIRAQILSVNKNAQLSSQTNYDNSFRVRTAKLWNILPADLGTLKTLESLKIGHSRFLEQCPDTPPVPGHTAVNDNSLLSWRKMHTMQLPWAWHAQTYQNIPKTYVLYWHCIEFRSVYHVQVKIRSRNWAWAL